MKPVCVDLFAGLGGWSDGFLAERYQCWGFDIERHDYGSGGYPGDLVLQDVLTLHGSQFKEATLLVASPPCTEYSYMAMPWSRGKQIAAALRGKGEFPKGYTGSRTITQLTALFDACFRIQREAIEAATLACDQCDYLKDCHLSLNHSHHIPMVVENVRGAQPWVGPAKWNAGPTFLWGDVPALMPTERTVKQKVDPHNRRKTGGWFYDNYESSARRFSSHSKERKAWSAEIAKIPFWLSSHIAKCYYPCGVINEKAESSRLASEYSIGAQ